MAVMQSASPGAKRFQAKGIDLPNMAALAALELDNILIGEAADPTPITELAELLRSADQGEKGKDGLLLLLDPTTAMAMHMAIEEADFHLELNTSGQLLEEAGKIGETLQLLVQQPDAAATTDKDEIAKLRSFCIELAERAAAGKKAVLGWEPQHPWLR